eukprot:8303169-Pyramimonas_sp.AAC.1
MRAPGVRRSSRGCHIPRPSSSCVAAPVLGRDGVGGAVECLQGVDELAALLPQRVGRAWVGPPG